MKTKSKLWLVKSLSLFLAVVMLSSYIPFDGTAADVNDPMVVVSLGDSYSSGEGITPFYGQDLPLEEKVWYEDWLAHRSQKSWPSRLYIPGMPEGKTLGNYRNSTGAYQWYFGAVSGAKTKHFKKRQSKPFCVKAPGFWSGFWVPAEEDIPKLPPQLSLFDQIPDGVDVDYVTLTVGGNDVDFTGIVKQTIHPGAIYTPLKAKFKDLWKNIDTHQENIEQVYRDINEKAKGTADIIVAGYPELFDKDGKGLVVAKNEATIINENVVKFNKEVLAKTIKSLQNDNIKIHFVDVAPTFAAGGGHQAYSDNAWINKIDFTPNDQDLDQKTIGSAYSMHPNSLGAQAYADLVNEKIAEIEMLKRIGVLSGRICKASDRTTPITNAKINAHAPLYSADATPDADGIYSMTLPESRYYVTVKADGYIPFKAYADVKKDQIEYMQTFLMVEGEETDIGSAQGLITNALTGAAVSGVTLDVRSGWNNADQGTLLTTVTTDDYGGYIVTLPIGNYTLCANKDGFATTLINIVVQKSNGPNQNATMTPVLSGDNYRIVLTWGENPRDLDSHVVGSLSDGNSFHVYYGYKSQYDGDIEVCNLDYDDTSSYGPETITLNATSSKPYYYYIYRYYGSGTVASSGAQIKVYQGVNHIATFNVPTNLGSGDYWNVFAIVDGKLQVRNTMTDYAETDYAASSAATFSFRAPATLAHPAYDNSYPAKEEPAAEELNPTESLPVETQPAIQEGAAEETEDASALERTEKTQNLLEYRKFYMDLSGMDQNYIWKVTAGDNEYSMTEETKDIYSVLLPVDMESFVLQGENDEQQIVCAQIDLSDMQDKNCIVVLPCEADPSTLEIMWDYYDPETAVMAEQKEEPTAAEKDTEVTAAEEEEFSDEACTAEQISGTEETTDGEITGEDQIEISENADAVS